MITITNNKVAGFEPRWAPFRGFSVLFDNPDPKNSLTKDPDTGDDRDRVVDPSLVDPKNSLTEDQDTGLWKIDCDPTAWGELDLYYWLDVALNALDCEYLTRTYLFCPLPPSSYHVTVWDGVNDDNIRTVKPKVHGEWVKFLRNPRRALLDPPESMSVVTRSNLMSRKENITFRFRALALWGNQVLVALLDPVDEASAEALGRLTAHRTALSGGAACELGISSLQDYTPHVSLGYFANPKDMQGAHAQLNDWTAVFRTRLGPSAITFKSLAVYGFTDMANFYTARRPSTP